MAMMTPHKMYQTLFGSSAINQRVGNEWNWQVIGFAILSTRLAQHIVPRFRKKTAITTDFLPIRSKIQTN